MWFDVRRCVLVRCEMSRCGGLWCNGPCKGCFLGGAPNQRPIRVEYVLYMHICSTWCDMFVQEAWGASLAVLQTRVPHVFDLSCLFVCIVYVREGWSVTSHARGASLTVLLTRVHLNLLCLYFASLSLLLWYMPVRLYVCSLHEYVNKLSVL